MNEYYTSLRKYWESEIVYAKEPEIWKSEAIGLWLSAKVLYDQQSNCLLQDDKTYPFFFGWRVIRMLIGFCLENLIKAYLIVHHRKDVEWFKKEGTLKIGPKGHDLLGLFEEANFNLNEKEIHFIGLFAMCALWAGRYPVAANEHSMPRKREPMPSSKDLLDRSIEMRQKYKNDPRIKYGDYWDLLHRNMGDLEFRCAENIYNRMMETLA